MASTWKQHDTWPPLRGKASDENGLMDLSEATSLKFLAKSGTKLIEGAAVAIQPPDSDGYNWKYVWAAEDLSVVGEYKAELEITWEPGKVQTVPNKGTESLVVEADQG